MTKIFCIHPSVTDVSSFLAFTCLEGTVDPSGLEWDPVAPDILFATEWTFYRKDLFATFSRLYGCAGLKVAWMGEAVAADMNIFDYAVGFDAVGSAAGTAVGFDAVGSAAGTAVGFDTPRAQMVAGGSGTSGVGESRFIRLPSPLDMFHRFIARSESCPVAAPSATPGEGTGSALEVSFRNDLSGRGEELNTGFRNDLSGRGEELKTSFHNDLTGRIEEAEALLARKTKFCNFLYSNPNAHPMRDTLFRTLDAARGVDSLGKHLNNTATPGTGYGNHYAECTTLKLPYRFSIASENAEYDGYTTEKIFTSLAAHTIPIYWGNRLIADDVNPACFINVRDFESLEALVSYVERVDSDPKLWASIVSQPWLTPTQEAAHRQRTAQYRSRMAALLSGSAPKAVPEGYHVDLYRQQFFKRGFPFERHGISAGRLGSAFHSIASSTCRAILSAARLLFQQGSSASSTPTSGQGSGAGSTANSGQNIGSSSTPTSGQGSGASSTASSGQNLGSSSTPTFGRGSGAGEQDTKYQ